MPGVLTPTQILIVLAVYAALVVFSLTMTRLLFGYRQWWAFWRLYRL